MSDRESQISYDIAYMQNLKKMMYINLFEKQKQTCTVTEQIYGYQGGIGSGERNKLQVLY